ncbi:MAG: site-2 protease family protein [Pelosinus sp.]|nr:site-2 protease family protein [Pelosinus sp.]
MWKIVHIGQCVKRRGILLVMGLFAAVKVGSTVGMALTILASLAVYMLTFGISFAIGLVALLLIHELGHVAACWVAGISTSQPLLIPFVGAVIRLKRVPENAKVEANVAIGGPAAGCLSALVCLTFYLWTDNMLFLILAYTACILNLFNLIPCHPLDGGKIADAISTKLWWSGAIFAGALAAYTSNIFMLLVFFMSLLRLWQNKENQKKYYQLTIKQRLAAASCYFGLLAVLSGAMLYIMEQLR